MAEWGLLADTTLQSGCCRGNEAVQCMLSLSLNQLSLTEDLGRQSWLYQGLPWEPVFCLSFLFFCGQVGSHLLQELASVSEPGTMAKSQAPAWLQYPSSGCAYLALFSLNKPPCRRPVLDTITEVSPAAPMGTSKGLSEERAAPCNVPRSKWDRNQTHYFSPVLAASVSQQELGAQSLLHQ